MLERVSLVGDSREVLLSTLHEHGPMLLAAARVITLDDDEAEDLVQVTFEIAIRHLNQLRDPGAIQAWLLRIQTREAFRVLRRLRRFVRLTARTPDLAAASSDPATDVSVRRALNALPMRTRAAVTLHHPHRTHRSGDG